MKPKEFIEKLKDLKLRRWGKDEYAKALNSNGEGEGTIDDPVMRIMSLVREGNYVYASKGTIPPEHWEDFSSGFTDNTEIVGQYSESTPNIVYFEFPGESESEDDVHVIAFLLSDDDYALVPSTISSEDKDGHVYYNDWVNNVTLGDYTSVEEVPKVTSDGYYEGWALDTTSNYVPASRSAFTLKDRNFNLILGFNATWNTVPLQ